MTSPNTNQFPGVPPMPVVELTLEQQFKMRQIEDALKQPDVEKEDIITIFVALQHQCYVLGNNIQQLIHQWPSHPNTTPEDPSKYGTL